MTKLNVSFEFEMDAEELKALAEAIACAPTSADVQRKIGGYAAAALREYADMITGEQILSTVTEVRERRLVALIRYTLKGMPDTHWVARIFNVPYGVARSTLRGVMARHRRRIEEALKAEVAAFIKACEQDANTTKWHVTWLNPVLVEMLNARLEAAKDSKERIVADQDVLGAWIVPNGSYEWIKDHL